MKDSGMCPKCGAISIAGPHRVFGDRHIAIDLPGIATATLEALTCIECGYTELYSDALGLQNIRRDGRIFKSKDERGTSKRCGYCGAVLLSSETICSKCGNLI